MDQIISIYKQFLSFFPPSVHGVVSLVLAIMIIYSIFKVLKHNFIWLILLIILLPASQPILKSIWEGALNLVKFLLTKR
jgi:hypothetical protein